MWLTVILVVSFILQLQIISNAFSISRKHHDDVVRTKNDDLHLHLFRRRQKMMNLDVGQHTTTNPSTELHTFPLDYNDTMIDQYFMDVALRQAQLAWEKDEVPIGAIIVQECNDYLLLNATNSKQERTFRIISEAYNLVETNLDASAHAELLALRQGAQKLQNWRYPPNSTLYSTLEPCPMCLASAQAFRIDNIVYGAPDNRLGAIQTHMNLMEVAKHPYHDVKSVVSGVRAEECGSIMVNFFRERRRIKKEEKQQKTALTLQETNDGDRRHSKMKRFRFGIIRKLAASLLGS